MREVSYIEVKEVVKDIPSNKIVGHDGFIIEFIKTCQFFIGEEVQAMVEDSGRIQ